MQNSVVSDIKVPSKWYKYKGGKRMFVTLLGRTLKGPSTVRQVLLKDIITNEQRWITEAHFLKTYFRF